MKGYECPICGAMLDAGEKCYCVKEELEALERALRWNDEEDIRAALKNAYRRVSKLADIADMDNADECEELLRRIEDAEGWLKSARIYDDIEADRRADYIERAEAMAG